MFLDDFNKDAGWAEYQLAKYENNFYESKTFEYKNYLKKHGYDYTPLEKSIYKYMRDKYKNWGELASLEETQDALCCSHKAVAEARTKFKRDELIYVARSNDKENGQFIYDQDFLKLDHDINFVPALIDLYEYVYPYTKIHHTHDVMIIQKNDCLKIVERINFAIKNGYILGQSKYNPSKDKLHTINEQLFNSAPRSPTLTPLSQNYYNDYINISFYSLSKTPIHCTKQNTKHNTLISNGDNKTDKNTDNDTEMRSDQGENVNSDKQAWKFKVVGDEMGANDTNALAIKDNAAERLVGAKVFIDKLRTQSGAKWQYNSDGTSKLVSGREYTYEQQTRGTNRRKYLDTIVSTAVGNASSNEAEFLRGWDKRDKYECGKELAQGMSVDKIADLKCLNGFKFSEKDLLYALGQYEVRQTWNYYNSTKDEYKMMPEFKNKVNMHIGMPVNTQNFHVAGLKVVENERDMILRKINGLQAFRQMHDYAGNKDGMAKCDEGIKEWQIKLAALG